MGWIAIGGRRTSDWINATDPMPVRALTEAAIDMPEVSPPPLESDANVTSVAGHDVLWVIPAPLPPNRHLRLHRRRVHVSVRVGDATIAGHAHIRPGAQLGDHIFRSGRRFVPLTDVELAIDGVPASWSLPVVILNAAHVSEIRGIDPPSVTAALPAPTGPGGGAPDEGADLSEPPGPIPETLVSRRAILLTALELLLAEGVIDAIEFQTKRAIVLND